MSKQANKGKSSKLKDHFKPSGEKPEEQQQPVKQMKPKEEFPRSYRLDSEVMNILKNTLDRINQISPKKVSEARLVKALIILSRDIDEEKLIKALKEVW